MKSNDTIIGAMKVVLSNLRLSKHEKECETKIVTRTPSSEISSPHFHNRLRLGHSAWKYHKNVELWWPCALKLPNYIFKNIRQLWTLRWEPTVGGGGWKINFGLLMSYILSLAPIAPIVPMFFSSPNSYVLHVSLALVVLSCSLLLPIKVNVFFWFSLVPSKRLKSGTKVITHVFNKFSKSSFVYDVLPVCNVMGSTTFPLFLAYLRFQSPSHLFANC